MNYRLFFQDVLVGKVERSDAALPILFGDFRPSGGTDRPEVRGKIADYVAYSDAADRIILEDGDAMAWGAYIEEHESRFLDLIESRDWWLEDDRGELAGILVPVFCRDSWMIWRWDSDR